MRSLFSTLASVPARIARSWKRAPLVIAAVVALVIGLGTGTAYAYFTSQGSGTGSATVGTPANVVLGQSTIVTVSSSGYLVPGGTGDLFVRVNNPNSFAVTVTGISQTGNVVVVGSAGCTSDTAWPTTLGNSGVSVPTNAAVNITVPANSGPSFTLDIPNAASMTTTSASACQGATFQVPVTITVQQQ